MLPTTLKTFVHPQGVYRLEYPAHWDQAQEDGGRACGFGPHDRDDVGLWISILPVSLDTDRLTEELPRLMGEALHEADAGELRRDTTLADYALKADMRKEGQGGHYWIVAGGDVALFASSQVPVAERDVWNPAFERLMASLHITRDEELVLRKVANEVMERLRARYPEENFEYDGRGIRGKNRVVFLSNLYREVQAAPARRADIIAQFVENLGQTTDESMGHETWEEVHGHILPVLKPREYIVPGTATQHLFTNEWLADVVICYVIRRQKLFRFVTGWDLCRWGQEGDAFHQLALDNLS